GGGLAADVAGLKTHAIDNRYVDAVGDGVGTLNGAPGVVLGHAELGFLGGMPADGGGIEEHGRALERGESRSFGKPLIPADQRAQAAGGGVEGAESQIAGGEVELFVVQRVVGDVHLAVEAAQGSVRIENGGGVVIDAGGALLK